jgi:hypothetical protein
MHPQQVSDQLEQIVRADDFQVRSSDLTNAWTAAGAGTETIEPILRFVEDHPGLDFGTPGSLVHFVERFHGMGYERKLLESIARKPTSHTVWMLNRLINGTLDSGLRRGYIAAMENAKQHTLADANVVHDAESFLKRLRS